MNRLAALTGIGLIALGLAIFAWKTAVLGLPVAPSEPEGLWRMDFSIKARGSGRQGSVRVPLPSTEIGQVVFDERSVSDRLRFEIRTDDGQRVGVWTGTFVGTHDISHAFRVQLSGVPPQLPGTSTEPPPEEITRRYGKATIEFPSQAPEVKEALGTLSLPGPNEQADRVRAVFGFVNDEVATVRLGSRDALLTLSSREGTPEGKVRLLVTLLRSLGIPARSVLGYRLVLGASPRLLCWVEAWVGGIWVPMSPSEGFFARRPAEVLVVRRGSLDTITTTGLEAASERVDALQERLRPEELAAMMTPPNPILARLSLYRLPVATQSSLRLLLLFPLGALVVSIARNIVGLATFGTFMPLLIAFSLREASLLIGLAMVLSVLAVGLIGRILLEPLHLLLVPRLSILLSVVILLLTLIAILGRGLETADLFSGVLLPIIILTMLIERFSITLAEEGVREALFKAARSLAVAIAVYPIFRSTLAEHLMFSFPELVFTVMGLMVLVGAYTGYRLTDLIRFRSLATDQEPLP